MELIDNYMQDDTLRAMLNALTQKVFFFNFEEWVRGGFFEGDYIPYSIVENGKVISNVSVNRMQFLQNGIQKNYIQLGTVMTAPEYRNRGLARKLMEYVIEEYKEKCDGFYLFGNLSAADFYRKLGFSKGTQFLYRLREPIARNQAASSFLPLDPNDAMQRTNYYDTVRHCVENSAFEQMNRFSLQMFYTANLSEVFYAEDIDCYAVIDCRENHLIVKSVICKKRIALRSVIERIPFSYHLLTLGFSPNVEDRPLFDAEPFDGGDDYRFFFLGNALNSIENEKLFFPLFSHA